MQLALRKKSKQQFRNALPLNCFHLSGSRNLPPPPHAARATRRHSRNNYEMWWRRCYLSCIARKSLQRNYLIWKYDERESSGKKCPRSSAKTKSCDAYFCILHQGRTVMKVAFSRLRCDGAKNKLTQINYANARRSSDSKEFLPLWKEIRLGRCKLASSAQTNKAVWIGGNHSGNTSLKR
jgi:hypothetical protein